MSITLIDDPADIDYIQSHFLALPALADRMRESADVILRKVEARQLPRPSYVLADGTAYFPPHLGELVCERSAFVERFFTAANVHGMEYSEDDAIDTWEALMSGEFSVCLKRATPENIVEKDALMRQIDSLRDALESRNDSTDALVLLNKLHDAVDRLDELELPFSPVFDRNRFGRPPSRDTYIKAIRERFPRAS